MPTLLSTGLTNAAASGDTRWPGTPAGGPEDETVIFLRQHAFGRPLIQ
jgi:hypothetical protein